MTLLKRFSIKSSSCPKHNLCSQESIGMYLHFIWDCPSPSPFWTQFFQDLLHLLGMDFVLTPRLFFLNHFWGLALSSRQRSLLLAALTAAKKLLVNRRNPPHMMDVGHVFTGHYIYRTLNCSNTWCTI